MSTYEAFRNGELTARRRPNKPERDKVHEGKAQEIFSAIDWNGLDRDDLPATVINDNIRDQIDRLSDVRMSNRFTAEGKQEELDGLNAKWADLLGPIATRLNQRLERIFSTYAGTSQTSSPPSEKILRGQQMLLSQAAAMPSGEGVMRLLEQQLERDDQEGQFYARALLPVAKNWLETTDRSEIVDALPVNENDPWQSLIEETESYTSDYTTVLSGMVTERLAEIRGNVAEIFEALETEGTWEGSLAERTIRHLPGETFSDDAPIATRAGE